MNIFDNPLCAVLSSIKYVHNNEQRTRYVCTCVFCECNIIGYGQNSVSLSDNPLEEMGDFLVNDMQNTPPHISKRAIFIFLVENDTQFSETNEKLIFRFLGYNH